MIIQQKMHRAGSTGEKRQYETRLNQDVATREKRVATDLRWIIKGLTRRRSALH